MQDAAARAARENKVGKYVSKTDIDYDAHYEFSLHMHSAMLTFAATRSFMCSEGYGSCSISQPK